MSAPVTLPTPPDDERDDVRTWRYLIKQAMEDVDAAAREEPLDCWVVKLSAQTGWTIDTWGQVTGWTERLDTHGAFASDTFTVPADGTLSITVNLFGGTPGAGSTNSQILVGIFKNGSLITDTVRGNSIPAGYYRTQDVFWVGDAKAGENFTIHAMFCPNAAGVTTTNATVGAYTEIDSGATTLVSMARFQMKFPST